MIVPHAHPAIERRRILRAFRSAGAIAPDRARSLSRLGLEDGLLLRRFRDNGIVREVKAGEYYLDEDAYKEWQQTAMRWVIVIMAIMLAAMIYAIAMKH